MARRLVLAAALLVGSSPMVFAQAPPTSLNDQQKIGRELFYQHCGVCHTKPNITAAQYGPSLSRATFENRDEADVKKVIADGAPDMPGFNAMLTSAQIDAVAAFLKQTPPPSDGAKKP